MHQDTDMSKSSHGKQTSPREAKLASEVLRDPNASNREHKLAGSVLSQVREHTETSQEMANFAAKIVDNPNASAAARSLAGSVLSQAEKQK